jgi:hypothetical protein
MMEMNGVRTVQTGLYEGKEICQKSLCVFPSFCQQAKKLTTDALRRLQIIRDCWKNRKAVSKKS